LWDALHSQYCNKTAHTLELIGCSIEFLKRHLQKTVDDRYGVGVFNINNFDGGKWHIDHIVPCSAFNLKCSYHQRLCFNYTNLQILSKKDNLEKCNKIGVII